MTSTRKIKANRANAQASTGPRTGQGKACSALNARRHGLSLSVTSNPVFAEKVETLAREFAGRSRDPEIGQLAHDVAEAQIDLVRIRLARHDLLARDLGDANYAGVARDLIRMERYERRATITSQVCNSRIRGGASTGRRINPRMTKKTKDWHRKPKLKKEEMFALVLGNGNLPHQFRS